MSALLSSYALRSGEGLAGERDIKASGLSTGGGLSVIEGVIDAGPPLHVHEREDGIYLLDGEVSVRCGNDTYRAATGSFVFLPRGRPHRFSAVGPPARMLLIAVPGGIEDYFREINAASDDAERGRIGERYAIRVVAD